MHHIAVHLAVWYAVWLVACLISALNSTAIESALYYSWLFTTVSICALFTSRKNRGLNVALACGFFVSLALFHQGIGYVLYVDGGGTGPAFFLGLLIGTQGAIFAAIVISIFHFIYGRLRKENQNSQLR